MCKRVLPMVQSWSTVARRSIDRDSSFEPTIFTNVEDSNFIAIEESFGPIMIVSKFPDE